MTQETKQVLIVEDEQVLLNTLYDSLTEEGFQVERAKNGEEGLNKALDTHPDLIILDVLMPRMGGIEMAKELRKDEWGKDAKVVILSNLSDMEKVQLALENNIFVYLTKSDHSLNDIIKLVKELTE